MRLLALCIALFVASGLATPVVPNANLVARVEERAPLDARQGAKAPQSNGGYYPPSW